MLNPRHSTAFPAAHQDSSSADLVGRRMRYRDRVVRGRFAEELSPEVTRETDELRRALDDREVEMATLRGELAQAYDRECDLVRILHRYVLAEQAAQERRRWWVPGVRVLR